MVNEYGKIKKGDTMKMISWNVNGIRACVNKGFYDFFEQVDADIFCLQETKMQEGQLELITPNHFQYFNYAVKKGYSGTAVFTKQKPIQVQYGMGMEEHDQEGRMITLEFSTFYFICVYVPNAQDGLKRIAYRLAWEKDFKEYVARLKENKPVVITGDLNVAHQEIDLKNPKQNKGNAGFSDEERDAFNALLHSGFIDTYRYLYPTKEDAYSWWSYRFKARERNAGWRIDYFLLSDDAKEMIKEASIYNEIEGSDHCPVGLEVDFAW